MAGTTKNPDDLRRGEMGALADALESVPPPPYTRGKTDLREEPTDEDIARRIRNWYLEAVRHPLWREYIRESLEDQGFYLGGEAQWLKDGSREDLARLKALGKAIVSINYCKPIVDVLVGFERQNRFDIRAAPQGDQDDEDARILSWLLKFVQEQADVGDVLSEVFKHGIIGGAGCATAEIDWTTDPVNGDIVVESLRPGREIIWDPYWKKYDLSDCAYVIRFSWVREFDLLAKWPQMADTIRTAVESVHSISAQYLESVDRTTTSGPPHDAYGSVATYPIETPAAEQQFFYDPRLRRLLVLEGWYMTYRPQWVVMDKEAGKVTEAETAEMAHEMARSAPKHLTAVQRMRRFIKVATVIPATYQVLEHGDTPYDNDADRYPFVPYLADKMDDVMQGVVRNLKDPQRTENKRIAQAIDLVAKFANIRPIAEENALVNPDTLNKPFDSSVVWKRPGKPDPKWMVPEGLGQMVNILVELANIMKMAPREVSGINTELMGGSAPNSATSGIAIARRQAQGQVIATPLFDNLRRTRKNLGQRLARRIQQRFTTEQVVRLIDDLGQPVQVRLNPLEYRGDRVSNPDEFKRLRKAQADEGKPHILRDLSALTYDITIAESPTTPSARQQALLQLLEVIEKMPQIMPAVLDVILELADVPQRQLILQRVQQMQAAQGVGVANAVPGGQNGGPSPAVPAGAPGSTPALHAGAAPPIPGPPTPPMPSPVAPANLAQAA